ncbi:MAG: LamG domain-containing protein, partial [Opitutaceae bacterium]
MLSPRTILGVAFTLLVARPERVHSAQPPAVVPPPQDRVTAIGLAPLTAATTETFSPSAQVTLEAWVYLPASGGGGWVAGKCWGEPGVDPFLSFALLVNDRQRPEFSCSTGAPGSYRNITATTPLSPQTWTHLAAVLEGTALRLYVNGVAVAN